MLEQFGLALMGYFPGFRLKSLFCVNCEMELTFDTENEAANPVDLIKMAETEHDTTLEGTDINCDSKRRRLKITYENFLHGK